MEKVAEIVAGIKPGFEQELAALDMKKESVNQVITKLDEIVAVAEATVTEATATAEQEGYNRGYDEGVLKSGEVKTDDKIYSLEELNAYGEEVAAPLKAKIEELNGAVASLQTDIDAKVAAAATAAVEAFKAEMLAAYDAQQVVESTAETGYRSMLMPKVVVAEPAPEVEPAPAPAPEVEPAPDVQPEA